MNGPERDELFTVLLDLARRYPNWRVGQLISNVAGWADADLWEAEDGQLLASARNQLSRLTESTNGAPDPQHSIEPVARK